MICGGTFRMNTFFDRLAIDVITGCETLRKWVDNHDASVGEFEHFLSHDEGEVERQSA